MRIVRGFIQTRSLSKTRLAAACGLAVALALLAFGAGDAAAAGTAQIGITRTNASPQNSGAATEYRINFSCSNLGNPSCGEDPVVRIPLELTSAFPSTPEMSTWKYEATTSIAGLIKEKVLENGEYVIRLDATKLVPGESDTILLNVTPPNGLTPNGTRWSLTPAFETSEIAAVEAPKAATGEATASAQLAVSKKTLDEGAVYVRGHQVTFNLTATCSGGSTGKLFLTEGSLLDSLPAGLEYVSATPAPTEVSPGPEGKTEILWSYPTAASLPSGCGNGSAGSTTYQVVANIPASGTDGEQVVNSAVFAGTPIDQAPKSTKAQRPLTLINEPPSPGKLGTNFLTKSSQAPLCIPAGEVKEEAVARTDCYAGTYPGHWIQPTNNSPALSPGSVEGRFDVAVRYPASRAWETNLVDPMPCLEEASGVQYSSLPITGNVDPSAIPNCANPAFHPTAVRIAAPSLATAVGEGWRPAILLTNGEKLNLTLGSNSGSSAYFTIAAKYVLQVSAIELPPNPALTDNQLTMNVFGYADGTLKGGDILRDVAVATAYPIGQSTPASTSRSEARIYLQPTFVQLGIGKSFGSLSNGSGGLTQLSTMTLVGSLTVPAGKTLPGNVILADLLPEGMTWSNPVASANFTVTRGLSSSKSVAATITRVPNYRELGRELIRVTLPASAFEEGGVGGFYTIKAPSNFFRMQVPNETSTFKNEAQLFVGNVGRETLSVCRAGEGTGTSEFESTDPLDLSGTGEKEVNYCQAEATLSVKANGGPNFSLKKFVQGELDELPKSALGVGQTKRGGTGVYTLVWKNNGSAGLKNPVVYDILPFPGDTGVDEGQAGVPRGSAFATEFVEVVSPLPSGVTVEYSTSHNPCRPEVNPAAGATCTEDWSTSLPAQAAEVKGIRLAATGNWAPGESFSVQLKIALPASNVNAVAWNSAAAGAETTTSEALRPAEPPKVGIEAKAPLIKPTLSTSISESSILPGHQVSDQITVGGTEERAGTVKWKLRGPVAPNAGSCTGLSWGSSAVVAEGEYPVAADGSAATASTSLTAHGCYGYEATLSGSGFETVTSPAGTAGELVLVHPATPTLSTLASAASILPEREVTDAITVAGTEGFGGSAHWKLLGPVAPSGGTCAGATWAGAATAAEGTVAIAGDETKPTAPSKLTAYGCYGYEVTLEGEHLTTATSPVGSVGETVLVYPAGPTVATAASAPSVLPETEVTDAITVAGTEGFPGVATWRLAGPVAPVADSCAGVDWSGAGTVAEGEVAFGGDGTKATVPTKLTAHGCYGYEVTLEGEHLTTAISPLGSAGETVLVHPATPTVATSASPAAGPVGTQVSDKIDIGGTAGFPGTVHWKLAGPVAPGPGESCAGLSWAAATLVADGRLQIGGDATAQTPATALAAPGCYGYEVTVEGPHLKTVTSPLGSAGEMVLIKAAPPIEPTGTPNLKLVKRVAEANAQVGEPLHYTIEVTNTGTAAALDTVVTDTPRSPLDFVSAQPSRGKCGQGFPLTCKLGTLAPGAKATVKVLAKALAGGRLVNDAEVSAANVKGKGGVKAAAASRAELPLRLSKAVAPHSVEAGGHLRYTLTATNPTAATAHGLKVCDRLPAGLAYLSSNPPAKLSEGRYCWTIAALKGHATKKIRLLTRVLEGTRGKVVNVATLEGRDIARTQAKAAASVKPRAAREGGVTG